MMTGRVVAVLLLLAIVTAKGNPSISQYPSQTWASTSLLKTNLNTPTSSNLFWVAMTNPPPFPLPSLSLQPNIDPLSPTPLNKWPSSSCHSQQYTFNHSGRTVGRTLRIPTPRKSSQRVGVWHTFSLHSDLPGSHRKGFAGGTRQQILSSKQGRARNPRGRD
jgi:hypothetical protein